VLSTSFTEALQLSGTSSLVSTVMGMRNLTLSCPLVTSVAGLSSRVTNIDSMSASNITNGIVTAVTALQSTVNTHNVQIGTLTNTLDDIMELHPTSSTLYNTVAGLRNISGQSTMVQTVTALRDNMGASALVTALSSLAASCIANSTALSSRVSTLERLSTICTQVGSGVSSFPSSLLSLNQSLQALISRVTTLERQSTGNSSMSAVCSSLSGDAPSVAFSFGGNVDYIVNDNLSPAKYTVDFMLTGQLSSAFNASSGVLTAPVAGVYSFHASLRFNMVTNGRAKLSVDGVEYQIATSKNGATCNGHRSTGVTAYMRAGSTAYVFAAIAGRVNNGTFQAGSNDRFAGALVQPDAGCGMQASLDSLTARVAAVERMSSNSTLAAVSTLQAQVVALQSATVSFALPVLGGLQPLCSSAALAESTRNARFVPRCTTNLTVPVGGSGPYAVFASGRVSGLQSSDSYWCVPLNRALSDIA
jgi:hypothetical protein